VLFKAAVGTVAAAAAPEARGEAMAGMFLIAYVGMTVPVVGMGIATQFVPPVTAMEWFTGLLLLLLGTITTLAR
jgi:hypothetical protein